MFSRYFQPYGLKRRLHVDGGNVLDAARHLRSVEVVDALRAAAAASPERVALLVEKADIDTAAGRLDASFVARALGEVEVKGRTRRVDVFAVACAQQPDVDGEIPAVPAAVANGQAFARDLADQAGTTPRSHPRPT